MTWLNAGQAISYARLSPGDYTVEVAIGSLGRQAIVRQAIPTGDITWFVSDLPATMHRDGASFRRSRVSNHRASVEKTGPLFFN
jgi:hypothetical protein